MSDPEYHKNYYDRVSRRRTDESDENVLKHARNLIKQYYDLFLPTVDLSKGAGEFESLADAITEYNKKEIVSPRYLHEFFWEKDLAQKKRGHKIRAITDVITHLINEKTDELNQKLLLQDGSSTEAEFANDVPHEIVELLRNLLKSHDVLNAISLYTNYVTDISDMHTKLLVQVEWIKLTWDIINNYFENEIILTTIVEEYFKLGDTKKAGEACLLLAKVKGQIGKPAESEIYHSLGIEECQKYMSRADYLQAQIVKAVIDVHRYRFKEAHILFDAAEFEIQTNRKRGLINELDQNNLLAFLHTKRARSFDRQGLLPEATSSILEAFKYKPSNLGHLIDMNLFRCHLEILKGNYALDSFLQVIKTSAIQKQDAWMYSAACMQNATCMYVGRKIPMKRVLNDLQNEKKFISKEFNQYHAVATFIGSLARWQRDQKDFDGAKRTLNELQDLCNKFQIENPLLKFAHEEISYTDFNVESKETLSAIRDFAKLKMETESDEVIRCMYEYYYVSSSNDVSNTEYLRDLLCKHLKVYERKGEAHMACQTLFKIAALDWNNERKSDFFDACSKLEAMPEVDMFPEIVTATKYGLGLMYTNHTPDYKKALYYLKTFQHLREVYNKEEFFSSIDQSNDLISFLEDKIRNESA
jgi:hypothetical protein